MKRRTRKVISTLLALVMVSTLLPTALVWANDGIDYGGLTVEQPVLLVSGDGLIAGGVYTAANISNEKSYTMDELQSLGGISYERLYSAINSTGTRRIYRSEGVDLAGLLALSGYTNGGSITAFSGTFNRSYDLDVPRYYYPGIADGKTEDETEVGAMLALKSAAAGAPAVPEPAAMQNQAPQLQVGQLSVTDVNNGLYVSETDTIRVGNGITGTHITVLGKAYTRAQMLMMPRADHEHSFVNSVPATVTTRVRGVPLAHLLRDVADDAVIEFTTVDNWAGISASSMTKRELVEKNAILAYETRNTANTGWDGYFRTNNVNDNIGYFRLFIDGISPAHSVNSVIVKQAEPPERPYQHINYQGSPYNLDAITGATLTVEGPGVVNSVPITVRQLEETPDSNIHNGVYADLRGGNTTERRYEGVKVLSILDGLVNSNVIPLDDTVVVVFKNRWRQEVMRMTYGEIKNASSPVIMAYGTAYADGSNISPFVFIQGAGADSTLGNEDGPLKLVYNQGAFPDRLFSSVAYMYIEEGVPPPGFKHITATNPAYNNVENTEFILTFTGDELGKEVNYTVRELEEMAAVNAALSHRDEYSLSNTTYWYVNEYEGIKLWDLLVDMGVDASKATIGGGTEDNTPLVSFASWDNYQISSQFSFHQLANPDLFYFYEKSPLDIGTDDRPTKQQLSTEDYQPDNQVGDWVRDANGYPVRAGYPVLLAYGVNSYPYVRNPGMEGFKSGLGNSGGPMRLIYGKTDGLNRANPDAEENYAYFFNNGSQQLQRVEEIYVGNDTRYSTHLQNPAHAYQNMRDQQALTVEIIAGGATQTVTFTLAELESILYGQGVAKRDRDNEGRQEKGYYYYRDAGGSQIEDLFEGVNLEYLLAEHIGMQGLLGTVELYSGSAHVATYDLSTIGAKGQNSMRSTAGLGSMVAFAKNGYPLVAGSNNSSNTSPGYVHDDDATGKAIRNGGGPLLFVRGQTTSESAAQRIETGIDNKTYVDNLTKIVVNLDPDPYAHTGSENASLAGQQVRFSGAVAQTGGASFTVGTLETKQRYIVDGEYTAGGATEFYRGLDLYALLYDKDIGASTLMSDITVKNANGDSKTLTYEELTAAGKKIILAYGSGEGDNAKPLGIADGGPMRLIIDGAAGDDCIINVSEIEVVAVSITAWKHNFGVYTQYADNTLEISGQNLAHNKTFTIAELEAMDNIIVQDSYKIGTNFVVVQGVELYKLLQNIGFAPLMDSSVFSVYASDGYSPGTFTASQLKDGINGKPILVAFGQGTTLDNGLPLVPNETSPGYDNIADNQSGPLRLMIHDNSGWSVKFLTKIVVGAAGGNPDPALIKDFDIHGLKGGSIGYSVKELSELPGGMGTKIETYSFVSSGNTLTDTVKGAYLYDLLKANGVSDNATVTVNTSDGFEKTANGANYRDIPMSEINDMKYFVAHEAGADESSLAAISDVRNGITAKVRVYRNYDDPATRMNRMTDVISVTVSDFAFSAYLSGENDFPIAGVRDVALDSEGGIWIGTDGGGAVYVSSDGVMTFYTTASTPALRSNTVTSVAIDPDGGVWLSQGGSSDPQGAAYYIDGQFEFFNLDNSGLPNNRIYSLDVDKDGTVWFATLYNSSAAGTFYGGLTKYVPSTDTWRSWAIDEGFPTVSGWVVKADDKGGAWITSYRDSTLTDIEWKDVSYAYVDAEENLKTFPIDVGAEPRLSTWSRSVAIDLSGGVYIVRSHGGHNPDNVGGYLDYISPDGSFRSLTGDSLIPDLKGKSTVTPAYYPEIRTAFVDAGGDLWLSTIGLGVYRFSVSATGALTFKERFSTETGSWPGGSAFDNVWSILVTQDGTAYIGGNGGMAWAKVALSDPPQPPEPNHVGDATEETAQLRITGAVEKPGYFTTAGLKTYTEYIDTVTYPWHTSSGPNAPRIFTGIYLEDLLKEVMTLNPNAESITVYARDYDPTNPNTFATLMLNSLKEAGQVPGAYSVDYEGRRVMLAWDQGGSAISSGLRLVVGQNDATHVNSAFAIQGIVRITVNAAVQPPPDHIGDATEATAQLRITGAVEKPGYFTLDGLKTYPGLSVLTRTYNTLNSVGTTGVPRMTGVYLEDLLTNVMLLSPYATSVTVTASDSVSATFNLDSNELGVFWTNYEGNKLMLAWARDGAAVSLRVAVPQTGPGHVNNSLWVSNIVSITVNAEAPPEKLPQNAPISLGGERPASEGARGRITGTTTAMEYSENQVNWIACTAGFTEVFPSQYHVRYAETATHSASIAIMVSVPGFQITPPPPPNDANVVLSIYNGQTEVKGFVQGEIDAMSKTTSNYSSFNTWPSPREYTDVTGVSLIEILTAAGINISQFANNEITFYASDNFEATLKLSDLTVTRYYFSIDGTRGSAVPSVISFGADGGRLYFGQLSGQEQTSQAFVEKIDRIVIGGPAGSWGRPTASPASGTVRAGDLIRLSLPQGSGEAKIYYTLDGTIPTAGSTMYNVVAERWFGQQGMTEHPPIVAPSSGEFTITARIIGLGRTDGEVVRFTYNRPAGTDNGDQTSEPGTTVFDIDEIPLSDLPPLLSEMIQTAVSEDGNGDLELSTGTSGITIPAESLQEMIEAELTTLIISTPAGSSSFDLEALQAIYGDGGELIEFVINLVDMDEMSDEIKEIVGEFALYELKVLRDGVEVSNLGAGHVTTRIFYTLLPGQSAYGLKVFHLSDDGKLTEVECKYNSVLGYIEFTRSSLSLYMLGYDADAAVWEDNPFKDVKMTDWFHDNVRYVYERGLMQGTSADTFSPGTNLTRGMIVAVLWRLHGEPEAGDDMPFSDIESGTYYTDAVAWAAANGIVNGYDDGRFGAGDNITRQDLTAMLARYADFAGISMKELRDYEGFSDAGRIADYATDAVERAFKAGVINGRDGGTFDPTGRATRAEFAAMLQRFIG